MFFTLQSTTNKETVADFFVKMSEQHDLTGNIIILDNHRAHLSHKVIELMEELHCHLVFLPAASSFLNPIEVFWA